MSNKELILDQETFDIKVQGEKYSVRYPTVDEIADYSDLMKKVDKDDLRAISEKNREFLDMLGIPQDLSKKFSAKQVKQIFEVVTGN